MVALGGLALNNLQAFNQSKPCPLQMEDISAAMATPWLHPNVNNMKVGTVPELFSLIDISANLL